MFQRAGQKVPKGLPQTGHIVSAGIPHGGIDARSALSAMPPEYALSLRNAMPEPYGLRTRKGYTEYATSIPGNGPVASILNYHPASAGDGTALVNDVRDLNVLMFRSRVSRVGPPVGALFAARGTFLFNVTAGGVGPWTAEAIVSGVGPYWNGINIQNIAGSFLCICNEQGNYAFYDGATWKMPAQGVAAGEIAGVNPNTFCYVAQYKKRLWFVEIDSTVAWYLSVDALTGTATPFNFGEQFAHGGYLVSLTNWTLDSGNGLDDKLVAISSEGDVVIYSGSDPTNATTFRIDGRWYTGPLPVGRRQALSTGGEVYILSQFGLMPISRLISATSLSATELQHVSFRIDPIIGRLMRDYSLFRGWQALDLAKEELIAVGIPKEAFDIGGAYLAYKVTTDGWCILADTTYVHMLNISSTIYAGTEDGRVVRAFDGPLDDVKIAGSTGKGIRCQIIPSYQPLGTPGLAKRISMLRPSFTAKAQPALSLQILTDYGVPGTPLFPAPPLENEALWDVALWDVAVWSGVHNPARVWYGVQGNGYAGTSQIDYTSGGDTILTNIDYWVEEGGAL